MGIHATLCHVCGAPVNHDHYSLEGEPEATFTSDHDWLRKAVAISILGEEPVTQKGRVEDNVLSGDGRQIDVGDGGLQRYRHRYAAAMSMELWQLPTLPVRRDDAL